MSVAMKPEPPRILSNQPSLERRYAIGALVEYRGKLLAGHLTRFDLFQKGWQIRRSRSEAFHNAPKRPNPRFPAGREQRQVWNLHLARHSLDIRPFDNDVLSILMEINQYIIPCDVSLLPSFPL